MMLTDLERQMMDRAVAEVRSAIVGLVDIARQEEAERVASPHRWALFHRYMWLGLPKWRRVARMRHKRAYRKYKAHAQALDVISGQCTGVQLSKAVGLEDPRAT